MKKAESILVEKKIKELLNQNLSYKAIAVELDFSYTRLYSFCRTHNLIKSSEITLEEKNILEKYSTNEAAKILEISITKVRNLKYKYKIKSPSIINQKHKDIINDYKLGIKQSDIAKKYHVSRQYVSQIVKKI